MAIIFTTTLREKLLQFYLRCVKASLLLSGYEDCTKDALCSWKCVQNYMDRYGRICARDMGKNVSSLTCEDYARDHAGGPDGCKEEKLCRLFRE